jgi:hypothetical protein
MRSFCYSNCVTLNGSLERLEMWGRHCVTSKLLQTCEHGLVLEHHLI